MEDLGRDEFNALCEVSPYKWTLSAHRMTDGVTCAFVRAKVGSLELTLIGRPACFKCGGLMWSGGITLFMARESAQASAFECDEETLAQLVERTLDAARAFASAITAI